VVAPQALVREVAAAGLQLGDPRYLIYSLAFALVGVAVITISSPPLEPLTRQGSAQRQFVGLGFGLRAITLAFLNCGHFASVFRGRN
jgi:hypothetical protein